MSIISLLSDAFSKVISLVASVIIASGLVVSPAPVAYAPLPQSTDQTAQVEKLTKENQALKQAAAVALTRAKSQNTSVPVPALIAPPNYPVISLSDIPAFDHNPSPLLPTVYAQFLTIPNLQHLTQAQQIELLQAIGDKFIFLPANPDATLQEHINTISQKINTLIADYQKKIGDLESERNAINSQYTVSIKQVQADTGASETVLRLAMQKLADEANTKLQALQEKENLIYTEFLFGIGSII